MNDTKLPSVLERIEALLLLQLDHTEARAKEIGFVPTQDAAAVRELLEARRIVKAEADERAELEAHRKAHVERIRRVQQ